MVSRVGVCMLLCRKHMIPKCQPVCGVTWRVCWFAGRSTLSVQAAGVSQPGPPDPGCSRSFSTATTNQTVPVPPQSLPLVSVIKPGASQMLYGQPPVHVRAEFMVSALFLSSSLGKKRRAGFPSPSLKRLESDFSSFLRSQLL